MSPPSNIRNIFAKTIRGFPHIPVLTHSSLLITHHCFLFENSNRMFKQMFHLLPSICGTLVLSTITCCCFVGTGLALSAATANFSPIRRFRRRSAQPTAKLAKCKNKLRIFLDSHSFLSQGVAVGGDRRCCLAADDDNDNHPKNTHDGSRRR